MTGWVSSKAVVLIRPRCILALAAFTGSACTPARSETLRLPDREVAARLIFADDFEDLENWAPESTCPPLADSGELLWPCEAENGMGTLWYKRRVEGPLLITYTVASDAGMDNINLIAYAEHPQDVLETTHSRTGEYAEYQTFPNYIVTFLTNGEPRWRVRFRRNPGFHLLSETYVDLDTTPGKPHEVAHLFDARGTMALYVDGRLLHTAVDTARPPYAAGYLGLRTWRTRLRYSAFRVYSIGGPPAPPRIPRR